MGGRLGTDSADPFKTQAAWLVDDNGATPAPITIALPRVRLAEATEDGADFVIGRLLGKGGMATVHEAQQVALGRQVAIKRAPQNEPQQPLIREAVIGARLQHPNIVPVHFLAETDEGQPVVVMRAISGEPWNELARTAPALDGHLHRHLEIFTTLCRAISYAHDAGIAHRDLKPANVRLGEFGEVYLLDWGVAAPLDGASVRPAGTPAYMAPEAHAGGVLQPSHDVFGLAATLLAALTGGHPHRETPESGLEPPATVPDGLAQILRRAGSADPSARPPSADALRLEVLRWEEDQSLERQLDAAFQQLQTLQELSAPNEVREHFAVARFAFEQVIGQDYARTKAINGLAHCFDHIVHVELDQGRAGAAQGWLDRHPDPSPALRQAVATGLRQEGEQAAEVAHLRASARVSDVRQVRVQVAWVFAAILTTAVTTVAGIHLLMGTSDTSSGPTEALRFALLPIPTWLVTVAAVAWMYPRLEASPAGRRLGISIAAFATLITLSRVTGLWLDWKIETIPAALIFELPLMAAWSTGMGTLSRRFLLAGAAALVCWAAVLSTLHTPWLPLTYNTSILGTMGLMMWAWWDAQRPEQERSTEDLTEKRS